MAQFVSNLIHDFICRPVGTLATSKDELVDLATSGIGISKSKITDKASVMRRARKSNRNEDDHPNLLPYGVRRSVDAHRQMKILKTKVDVHRNRELAGLGLKYIRDTFTHV